MLKDLTYKVIVIDDEEDLYSDYTQFIQKQLSAEGYILEEQWFEELSDLESNPLTDVDLFLVDLKFGNEDKGPEFIKRIRENHLTDILFYSSDTKAIQRYRTSGEYQGVFFAIRDENNKEIFIMIDLLIKKMIKRSNTPLSSRGIVLGCVAELDNVIKSKIASLLSKLSPEQSKGLIDKCTRLFYDSYKGQSGKINEFLGCDFHNGIRKWEEVKYSYNDYNLNDLVANVKITDSNKNFHILLKTYELVNGKDDTYNAIKNFYELLDDRNIFAHVQEELNEDRQYQFKRLNDEKYLILSEDKCRELRTEIVKYFLHITSILN